MTGQVLPYHIEQGDLILSLRFVNTSREKAESVVDDFETDRSDRVRVETRIEEFSFEDPLYAVYAAKSYPKQFPDNWAEELPPDETVLVDSVINTFRGVKNEWENRGESLKYYKKPEPTRISEAFDQVEWRQDVPVVGGELMSRLVLKHALPNANHRTAVAYLRTYLQSVTNDPTAEFTDAGNYKGDWHDWAREHVYESKRLLMLRRKADLLKYASSFGVETVRRKSGVEVDLTAQEFENQNVPEVAEEGHRNRCIQFAVDLIERSGHEELRSVKDDGKRAFVDRLQ